MKKFLSLLLVMTLTMSLTLGLTDYETSSECFLAVQNKTADMVILDYITSVSALATMNNLKMLNLDFTEPEGASIVWWSK